MKIADTRASLIRFIIFTIITVLATGVLATTIANTSLTRKDKYRAVFSDVTGLLPNDDVRVAGVRVGQVKKMSITGDGDAEVTFTVQRDRPLSTTTRAFVRYRNLVGGRYIELTEGTAAGRRLEPGSLIPLGRTRPALNLNVLFNGFKPLFAALSPSDVNKLSYEIIRTLQGEGGTIGSLLHHTASLTGTLADRDRLIGDVVTNLNGVLSTVGERDEQFAQLVTELQRLVSGLAADREAIGSSLADIDAVAAATAGLLRDGRPALKTDIAELASVAGLLDRNRKSIDEVLRRLPADLNTITRTATYGGWFNFFLCNLDGFVVLPNGQHIDIPETRVEQARCKP